MTRFFFIKNLKDWLTQNTSEQLWTLVVVVLYLVLGATASIYSYINGYMIAYGDSESHLNISKRVVDSLTPGLAQLGGIWLPLPHLLMAPLTKIDILWRSGFAGAIVSGGAFVITGLYLFKLVRIVTRHTMASFIGTLVFALNPNILYLQSTAMTELLLIMFFVLSTFYFISFLLNDSKVIFLILSAFFVFCATLTRYDGWMLAIFEAGLLGLYYLIKISDKVSSHAFNGAKNLLLGEVGNDKGKWQELEGKMLIFLTLAFLGIALWLLWDFLILSDPFYFMNSTFSAKSQQQGWLARGELPSYKNIYLSFLYYTVTSGVNIGILLSVVAIGAVVLLFFDKTQKLRFYLLTLLFVPFFFYVTTLFAGQSVIFIPYLTPDSFEWNLFNVRYGTMMIPSVAILVGYLFYSYHTPFLKAFSAPDKNSFLLFLRKVKLKNIILIISSVFFQVLIASTILFQTFVFALRIEPVISWQDGVTGLSSAELPDAQHWLSRNYDHGLVLLDDYARTISVIKSGLPMENVIYIGNKPYWEESLIEPEKYARWIVMQKDDSVWNSLYDDPEKQKRLYKYFEKSYTSSDILIFKRSTRTQANAR